MVSTTDAHDAAERDERDAGKPFGLLATLAAALLVFWIVGQCIDRTRDADVSHESEVRGNE